MNDEIKEILEALDNTACCPYHDDMCKKAKNYITNLQQENEILKENAIHNDKVVDNAKWNEMIYKSRCEKLEEYINTHKVSGTISFPLMKKEEENQVKSCFDYEFEQIYKKELLNILNSGDEE